MTTTTHVPTLEHGIHATNAWLRDVAAAGELADVAAVLPADIADFVSG